MSEKTEGDKGWRRGLLEGANLQQVVSGWVRTNLEGLIQAVLNGWPQEDNSEQVTLISNRAAESSHGD